MKKLLILTVILAFVAMSASAQVSKPFNIYVGGGLNLPMSPEIFKDYWKTGFHGMGAFGFNSGPNLQILGKIEYHTFPFDFGGIPGLSGMSFNTLMYGGAAKFDFGVPMAPTKPFVLGGMGMATLSVSDLEGVGAPISFDVSETKIYIEFGGGVEFKMGPTMNLFLMGRYVNVSSEGDATAFVPITVGLKF